MEQSRTADDLSWLATLEPGSQAEVLTRLAQEARLVRLALDDVDLSAVAQSFERALGEAMDADHDEQTVAACGKLTALLSDARNAGLRVSASMSELSIDGVLGAMRMPVLTAFLSTDRGDRLAAA